MTGEELKTKLYRVVKLDERKVDIQKFKADIMKVLKLDRRKPAENRTFNVKHVLIDYVQSNNLANMVRPG